jgi:hypothetical protein
MAEDEDREPAVRLLCWNLGNGKATWADVGASDGYDVALLQQAPDPSGRTEITTVPPAGSPWRIGRAAARTAIARLSEAVTLTELATSPVDEDEPGRLGISRQGSLTVATVTLVATGEAIDVASVYGQWDAPATGGTDYYADAAMHRILSDLSPLIVAGARPLIVAGDFNSVLGVSGEEIGERTAARHAGIFDRMEVLGLRLAGPRAANPDPMGSSAADASSSAGGNVATFGAEPADRTQQIDYCYVSEDLAARATVVAHDDDASWGPSDHCRITIEVAAR